MFFFDIKEELSLICHILCCSHAYECVNIYATSVNVLAYRRYRAHGEGRKEIMMTHFRFRFSVSPSDVSTERHSEKKKRYLIKCPLSSTVFYINQKIPVQRVNAASCRAAEQQQQQRRSEAIWLEIIVAWNQTEIKKKSSSIYCSQTVLQAYF